MSNQHVALAVAHSSHTSQQLSPSHLAHSTPASPHTPPPVVVALTLSASSTQSLVCGPLSGRPHPADAVQHTVCDTLSSRSVHMRCVARSVRDCSSRTHVQYGREQAPTAHTLRHRADSQCADGYASDTICHPVSVTTCVGVGCLPTTTILSTPFISSHLSPAFSSSSVLSPSSRFVGRFICPPNRWNRITRNGQVVYISPCGSRVTSFEDVYRYLSSSYTCKCGLECPLIVEKVFDFNPKVPTRNITLDSSKHDLPTCNHIIYQEHEGLSEPHLKSDSSKLQQEICDSRNTSYISRNHLIDKPLTSLSSLSHTRNSFQSESIVYTHSKAKSYGSMYSSGCYSTVSATPTVNSHHCSNYNVSNSLSHASVISKHTTSAIRLSPKSKSFSETSPSFSNHSDLCALSYASVNVSANTMSIFSNKNTIANSGNSHLTNFTQSHSQLHSKVCDSEASQPPHQSFIPLITSCSPHGDAIVFTHANANSPPCVCTCDSLHSDTASECVNNSRDVAATTSVNGQRSGNLQPSIQFPVSLAQQHVCPSSTASISMYSHRTRLANPSTVVANIERYDSGYPSMVSSISSTVCVSVKSADSLVYTENPDLITPAHHRACLDELKATPNFIEDPTAYLACQTQILKHTMLHESQSIVASTNCEFHVPASTAAPRFLLPASTHSGFVRSSHNQQHALSGLNTNPSGATIVASPRTILAARNTSLLQPLLSPSFVSQNTSLVASAQPTVAQQQYHVLLPSGHLLLNQANTAILMQQQQQQNIYQQANQSQHNHHPLVLSAPTSYETVYAVPTTASEQRKRKRQRRNAPQPTYTSTLTQHLSVPTAPQAAIASLPTIVLGATGQPALLLSSTSSQQLPQRHAVGLAPTPAGQHVFIQLVVGGINGVSANNMMGANSTLINDTNSMYVCATGLNMGAANAMLPTVSTAHFALSTNSSNRVQADSSTTILTSENCVSDSGADPVSGVDEQVSSTVIDTGRSLAAEGGVFSLGSVSEAGMDAELDTFLPGDLVWGSNQGYESWPGRIIKRDDLLPAGSDEVYVEWFGQTHTIDLRRKSALRKIRSSNSDSSSTKQKRSVSLNSDFEEALQQALLVVENQRS